MQTIVKYFVALLLLLLSQFISSPESDKTFADIISEPSEVRVDKLCEIREENNLSTLES